MLKTATEMWDIHTSDLASFDPIVDLLMGACSVELEKVYQEISSSNARVLERLSKLLLPDVYKNTKPAHSVIYANPYVNNLALNKYFQFAYVKKVQAKESSMRENQREVFFSPVIDYPLIKASVAMIGTNTGLYSVENLLFRQKAGGISSEKTSKFLWIGLELDDEPRNFKDIILYFDWLTDPRKEKLLEFLPFTTWYLNDSPLSYLWGFEKEQDARVADTFNLDNEYIATQEILQYYYKHYITLHTQTLLKNAGPEMLISCPDEFKQLYQANDLKKIKNKYLWIKGAFPPFFTNDNIDDAVCQVNAVPVINRKLNELNYRILPETLNIIPLRDRNIDESFFNMESAKSVDGNPYLSTNLDELNQLKNGSYVIRKGGVQRFDQRQAKEYLDYMIDLLRDESAAFSVFGQEMLTTDITALNQALMRIEQKIVPKASGEEHTTDYLILKSFLKEDNVFIEYWSTSGEMANNIAVGSDLNLYRGDDIDASSLKMISKSTGGKDELTSSEMLRAFKQSLVSRGRIITVADIKSLCYSEMGSLIRDVRVSKSFVIDSAKKTGFKRVVKVEIVPSGKDMVSESEWLMYKLQIETKLNNLSFSDIPIEITLIKS